MIERAFFYLIMPLSFLCGLGVASAMPTPVQKWTLLGFYVCAGIPYLLTLLDHLFSDCANETTMWTISKPLLTAAVISITVFGFARFVGA